MNNEKNCFKSDTQVFDQKLSVLNIQLKKLNQKVGSYTIEKYKNIEKLENWISPLIWLSINVIIITLLYFEPMPKKFIGLILIYPLNLIFYDIFSEFILHLLFKIFTSGLSKSAVDKFLYEVYIKSGEIKRVTEIREFYIKVNNKINEIYSYKERANSDQIRFNENEKKWEQDVNIDKSHLLTKERIELSLTRIRKYQYYQNKRHSFSQYVSKIDSCIEILNKLMQQSIYYCSSTYFYDTSYNKLKDLYIYLYKLPHIFPYIIPSFEQFENYGKKKSNGSRGLFVSKPRLRRPKPAVIKDIFEDEEKVVRDYIFDKDQYIQNLDIGEAGECFIIEYEKKKLKDNGRHDLAEKVKHVSKDNVNGPGYLGAGKRAELKSMGIVGTK
jgi:hypothetical protein